MFRIRNHLRTRRLTRTETRPQLTPTVTIEERLSLSEKDRPGSRPCCIKKPAHPFSRLDRSLSDFAHSHLLLRNRKFAAFPQPTPDLLQEILHVDVLAVQLPLLRMHGAGLQQCILMTSVSQSIDWSLDSP